jgi:hypothetical protein
MRRKLVTAVLVLSALLVFVDSIAGASKSRVVREGARCSPSVDVGIAVDGAQWARCYGTTRHRWVASMPPVPSARPACPAYQTGRRARIGQRWTVCSRTAASSKHGVWVWSDEQGGA